MITRVDSTELFPTWIAHKQFAEPTPDLPQILQAQDFHKLKKLTAFETEMLEVATQVRMPDELAVLSVEEYKL